MNMMYRCTCRTMVWCVIVFPLTTLMTYAKTPNGVMFRDDHLSIEVIGNSNAALALSVTGGISGWSQLELPAEIYAVDSIAKGANERFVLIGQTGPSVREVVILNGSASSIMDRFLAYQPTLSPHGRYIVYTHFYPEHFINETQANNVAMLYDLTKSAKANRNNNASTDNIEDVGLVIDLTEPGTDIVHTFLQDQYYWSPDSSKIVFLDEQHRSTDDKTTVSQIRRNINIQPKPTLKLILVNVQSMTIKSANVDQSACAISGGSCLVTLKAVSFRNDGTIDAELQGFSIHGTYHNNLSFPPSEFSTQ